MKHFRMGTIAVLTALMLAVAGCGGGGGGGGAASPTDPNQVVFDSSSKTLSPLSGGTMSAAVAINDGGSVVGISSNTTQQVRGAKWAVNTLDGSVSGATELQPLPGFNYSAAYGINESGFVAGESEAADNTVVATYWANSSTAAVKLTELVAGKNSAAYSLSASGRIVGESVNNSDKIVPVYWSSSLALPVALPILSSGGTGVAYSIIDKADGSSIIVGESDDRAVRWRVNAAGVPQAVEDMGLLPGHIKSVAMGVNKSDIMVGESEDATGAVHAVVFKDKTLLGVVIPGFDVIDLGVAGVKSSAVAINDNSSIAGWSNDPLGSSLTALWLAFATPASTINTSLSGSGGSGFAFGINARNYIVGVKSDRGFVAIPK